MEELDMQDVAHCPECTWLRHVHAGETPPGQSFWGGLNYLWCQGFCERPIARIDFARLYEAAYGKYRLGNLVHRLKYNALVRRAIRENSNELKQQALRMTSVTYVNAPAERPEVDRE